MATQVQLRRGNTSQTNAFTGAVAEITIDTDKDTVVVHDGSTLGGIPLAKEGNLTAIFVQANSSFDKANTANDLAQGAYNTANNEAGVNATQNTNITSANTIATGAFDKANSANVLAQEAYNQANTATSLAQGGYDQANTATTIAQGGYDQANTATTLAQGAFNKANSANVLAQEAYDSANTKFSSSGGTISGDVTVSGNLIIIGEQVYANTETVLIKDNIITLNAAIDQSSAPSSNAGLEIDRGSSSNVYLIWNETADKWQFTNNGTDYFSIADEGKLNSAFDLANTNAIIAQGGYDQANTVYLPSVTRLDVTNSGSSAYLFDQYSGNNPELFIRAGETLAFSLNVVGHPFLIRVSSGGTQYSNGLTHVSNTGTVLTEANAQAQVAGTLYWKVPAELAGNTYVYQCQVHGGMVGNIVIERPNQANSAAIFANLAFDKANSAATFADLAFDKANSANVLAQAAFNAANTANITAEASFSKANSVNDIAQAAFNTANTNANTITLSFTQANNAFDKANSANILAQASFDFANTISGGAAIDNVARESANSATILAQAAFDQANTAVGDSLAFAIALG
jgi:hypothetical protein